MWEQNVGRMDVEFESISANLPESSLMDHMNNGLPTNHSITPPVCSICQMTPSTDSFSYVNGNTVGLCGHCKFLLLEDLNTPTDDLRRRRLHRGRRSIVGSSESIEDFFSQEFSQMMNLARHNQLLISEHYDPPGDSDVFSRVYQRTNFRSTPDGSRRWRRMSDTESDGFDNMDSFYGETESNSSLGARIFQGDSVYGGDSDVSMEDSTFLETETIPQSTERVDFESDSDIDPMHTGLVTWDSDGSEDAYGEENAVQLPNTRYPSETSPGSSSTRNRFLGLEQIIHLRFREREYNPFYSFSRRGAPPASESFVNNLPRVFINPNQKKPNEVSCAVCKDPMFIGSEAIQLPCLHLYHPCCILPWLARRNTCPLCRHQLPTDDMDFDMGSRHANPSSHQNESSSDEDVFEPMGTATVEDGIEIQRELGNLGNGGRGRWCFRVAGPVVSILGIVLVMWLGTPQKTQRISPENNQRQTRRWWHWF
ncbi:hypothetical protein V2J09_012181 [Rumex salicifolius]